MIQQNVQENALIPENSRSMVEPTDIQSNSEEIARLKKQIQNLERLLNEEEEDENDLDYEQDDDNDDEYNINDQLDLDFLETKTIKNGCIKLISAKTLR